MTTDGLTTSNPRGSLPGMLSFISGLIAAVSVAMIALTSFTTFDPPGWLRIATMAPLPVAFFAALGFGLNGLKKGASRALAAAGLTLAGLSLVGFIVIIIVGG